MILLHPLHLMLARFCGIRLHWPSADESCSQGKRKSFRVQTKVESDIKKGLDFGQFFGYNRFTKRTFCQSICGRSDQAPSRL
jgi:hypothetical protein